MASRAASRARISERALCARRARSTPAAEPVTADTLMERVWDGDPPPTGLDTLQSYLSRCADG